MVAQLVFPRERKRKELADTWGGRKRQLLTPFFSYLAPLSCVLGSNYSPCLLFFSPTPLFLSNYTATVCWFLFNYDRQDSVRKRWRRYWSRRKQLVFWGSRQLSSQVGVMLALSLSFPFFGWEHNVRRCKAVPGWVSLSDSRCLEEQEKQWWG